jgi:hypothetical protein
MRTYDKLIATIHAAKARACLRPRFGLHVASRQANSG